MSYEINEVVIIDGSRNIVNAGVGTFTKVHPAELEVGTSGLSISNVLNETDLNSDSASALPTQHAVKAYVDNAISIVQSDVDANETASDNAESALSGRLDTLEADPTTASALASAASIAADATIANEVHIDKAAILSGVAKDSEDLGTFTGSTISDASTIKAALQDLENGVDNALGGGAAATSVETVTTAVDAAHYLTFVNADNGTGTQENVFTDAGIQYNPSTNILTAGEVVVTGDLTVNGSQTVINTTTITTEDKNITLGVTTSPTDAGADGGGFTLKGDTDKTFNWVNATGSFTASEHIDLASGKQFLINNAGVLNATTLGAGVLNSSLTSVGSLTDLTVAGDMNANGNIVGDGASNISGINTVTASGKMYALSYTSTSDANLKENVEQIEGAVEKVEAIRGVTFDWKDGSGSTAGIIAQEVEAVMPMLVESGEIKRVEYNGLVGLLIEAVKELSAEIKELKANN